MYLDAEHCLVVCGADPLLGIAVKPAASSWGRSPHQPVREVAVRPKGALAEHKVLARNCFPLCCKKMKICIFLEPVYTKNILLSHGVAEPVKPKVHILRIRSRFLTVLKWAWRLPGIKLHFYTTTETWFLMLQYYCYSIAVTVLRYYDQCFRSRWIRVFRRSGSRL